MFLKELTELSGVSSCEYEVRNYIKSKLDEIGCEYYTDKIGNVIAHNKGCKLSQKIMLTAHMDEVGMIITGVDNHGFLKFSTVGNIDQRVLNSKKVVIGPKKITGVIGSTPIHLMSQEDRGKSQDVNKMYIDIGAYSKEEAEKYVNIGDRATFKTLYSEFGDNMIMAKALDNRVGCSAVLEILNMKLDADFYAVFTVMHEVGQRGAYAAGYGVEPDLAVILEAAVSADVPKTDESSKMTVIGGGTAVSLMDKSTLYDADIIRYYMKKSYENNIPCQVEKSFACFGDSGPLHLSKTGCKTIVLAVPCRYMHSAVSVCNKKDYDSMVKMTKMILTDNK